MNKKENEAYDLLEQMVMYRPINSRRMHKELEAINILLCTIKEQEKEIKVNNLMLKLKDKKLNEYKGSIPRNKIIELLNKNSKFNFISKADIEKLLNE